MAMSVALQGNPALCLRAEAWRAEGPIPPALEETHSRTTREHKSTGQILQATWTLAAIINKVP